MKRVKHHISPVRSQAGSILLERCILLSVVALSALLVCGCASFIPTIGPSRSAIEGTKPISNAPTIQLVDIDEGVTRRLLDQRAQRRFSETLGNVRITSRAIGAGDVLEVSIWEAAPA